LPLNSAALNKQPPERFVVESLSSASTCQFTVKGSTAITSTKSQPGTPLCWAALIFLLAIAPNIGWGQGNAPATLPPAAQEALNKGILAAKVPDYLLAIRYFEDARKTARDAPVILFNLGLAESRIPGRELRAMAWFGAYLASYPDAPNAAAVKDQIAVLDVKNQSNVSRLIKSMQDAASQIPYYSYEMLEVAVLWANSGDIAVALNTADLIQDKTDKSRAQALIANAQTEAGDITGAKTSLTSALRTADLIPIEFNKSIAHSEIANAQAKAGDIAGARKTVDLLPNGHAKSYAQLAIAEAQTKVGDIAGAQKTMGSALETYKRIQDRSEFSNEMFASAHARAGIAKPPIQTAIAVSDWLKKLDEHKEYYNKCPLNTGPFLDLAGHLKPLPASGDPKKIFTALRITAQDLICAQSEIAGMLKQQAKR